MNSSTTILTRNAGGPIRDDVIARLARAPSRHAIRPANHIGAVISWQARISDQTWHEKISWKRQSKLVLSFIIIIILWTPGDVNNQKLWYIFV